MSYDPEKVNWDDAEWWRVQCDIRKRYIERLKEIIEEKETEIVHWKKMYNQKGKKKMNATKDKKLADANLDIPDNLRRHKEDKPGDTYTNNGKVVHVVQDGKPTIKDVLFAKDPKAAEKKETK